MKDVVECNGYTYEYYFSNSSVANMKFEDYRGINYCDWELTDVKKAEDKLMSIVGPENIYFVTKDFKGQGKDFIYFTSLSIHRPDIKDILEIGTGKGEMTNLFSKLWPDANIITCDLSEDDESYQELAIRKNDKQFFNKNINQSNVKYINKNSFFLPEILKNKKFDFIFVDGGHDYPAVAWDIMYAYNHCKKDGYVFFHDVNEKKHDVFKVLKNIKKVIPEILYILPSNNYETWSGLTAWIKKGDLKK